LFFFLVILFFKKNPAKSLKDQTFQQRLDISTTFRHFDNI